FKAAMLHPARQKTDRQARVRAAQGRGKTEFATYSNPTGGLAKMRPPRRRRDYERQSYTSPRDPEESFIGGLLAVWRRKLSRQFFGLRRHIETSHDEGSDPSIQVSMQRIRQTTLARRSNTIRRQCP